MTNGICKSDDDDFIYEKNLAAKRADTSPMFYPEIIQALECYCGPFINDGSTRNVYMHKTDPDLVVKIEGVGSWHWGSPFDNWKEAAVWNVAKDIPELAKWFVPQRYLSPRGWYAFYDKVPGTETWDESDAKFSKYVKNKEWEKPDAGPSYHDLKSAALASVPDFVFESADLCAWRNWSLMPDGTAKLHDYSTIRAKTFPRDGVYEMGETAIDEMTAKLSRKK